MGDGRLEAGRIRNEYPIGHDQFRKVTLINFYSHDRHKNVAQRRLGIPLGYTFDNNSALCQTHKMVVAYKKFFSTFNVPKVEFEAISERIKRSTDDGLPWSERFDIDSIVSGTDFLWDVEITQKELVILILVASKLKKDQILTVEVSHVLNSNDHLLRAIRDEVIVEYVVARLNKLQKKI